MDMFAYEGLRITASCLDPSPLLSSVSGENRFLQNLFGR